MNLEMDDFLDWLNSEAVTERCRIAVTMRRDGATFRAIGAALGVSGARVQQLVLRTEGKYTRHLIKTANKAERERAQPNNAIGHWCAAIDTPIAEMELSVRSYNCLRHEGIETLGDIVMLEDRQMLRWPNFGRKSLNEVREVQRKMMEIPPEVTP